MNVREEVYEQIIDIGFHFTVIHKYRNILFQKLFSHLETILILKFLEYKTASIYRQPIVINSFRGNT